MTILQFVGVMSATPSPCACAGLAVFSFVLSPLNPLPPPPQVEQSAARCTPRY